MQRCHSLSKSALAALIGAGLFSTPAHAEDLIIAAAADLAFALPEISRQFSARHPGARIRLSLGSSGNFQAQIQNGAPYRVCLSADEKYPRDLIARGFAVADTYFVYGTGRIRCGR